MDGFWRTIKNRGIRTIERRRRKKVLKLALGAAERGEAEAQHQLLCECGPKK